MEFKESLKKIRQEKSLSQQKLADLVGVKQYVIASWETGRSEPSIKDLINLKNTLDVSFDYLLGLSNSQSKLYDLDKKIMELDDEKQDKLIDSLNNICDIIK